MNKPIIIVCGLSGSGKTYNSKILENRFEGYKRLNLGWLREKLGITTYSRKDTPKLLALAIEEMEQNQQKRFGTILDANLKSVDLRQCFYDLARDLGTEVVVIELVCPDEVAKQRMEQREQITKAENPKDYRVFLEQKKVWQDTLVDLELKGNDHVTLVRFNTERKELELVEGKNKDNCLVEEIIEVLKKKNSYPQES